MQLRLVALDDVWSYDPNDCLSSKHKKNSIKHVSRSSWEGRIYLLVNDRRLYVGPSDFPVIEYPPWLAFYPIFQRNNSAKSIPRNMWQAMENDFWPKKKINDF